MESKSTNGANGITASLPLIAGNSMGLGGGAGLSERARFEKALLSVEAMDLKPVNVASGIIGSAPLIVESASGLGARGAGRGSVRLATPDSVAGLDSGAASDVVGLDFAVTPVLALAGVIRTSDVASGAIMPNRLFNPAREPLTLR